VNDASTTPAEPLPAGWRWESYHDVEVGVPDSWGDDNGSQRINQWCIAQHLNPAVGRPGPNTLVGCPEPSPGLPSGGTLVATTGTFVAFEAAALSASSGSVGPTVEGDRVTVRMGESKISVQAAQPLRDQILATIHRVAVDHNGCPVTDPITADPGRQPADPIAVRELTGVRRVATCRYELNGRYVARTGSSSLISSIQLVGTPAAEAIAAVAAAPKGGGPDSPETCTVEVSFGEEVVVLRITSDRRESQVHLRFSGCDHNGLDDGVTVRRLTKESVAPFLVGANRIFSFSGTAGKEAVLLDLLSP
jgi:hypothetical protein